MQKIAKLEPINREKLSVNKSISKTWSIINPTNHTLVMLSRDGSSATINTTMSNSLDKEMVYFQLTYEGSISSNLVFPNSSKGNVMELPRSSKISYCYSVNEILTSSCGVYIEELDVVIGPVGRHLEFPKLEIPELQIHDKDTVLHQFFVSTEAVERKGFCYTDIFGKVFKVKIISTKLSPGLYVFSSEHIGASYSLIGTKPNRSHSEKQMAEIIKDGNIKVKPIEYNGVDIGNFNNYIGNLASTIKSELNKVDNAVDEEFKIRDIYRKDTIDEIKTSRAANVESQKSTNEALKAAQAAAGVFKATMANK